MILHYDITVTGKVQGVWYRKSTLEKASDLGIKGFVKNMPDKSVYIEAEGNKTQLDLLLSWCNEGPQYANVEMVDFSQSELRNFDSFEIIT